MNIAFRTIGLTLGLVLILVMAGGIGGAATLTVNASGGGVVNLGQPIPGKSNIWALTTGVDGKIYGGTGEGGTLFVYDPINNISEPLGRVSGEDAVYSLATDEKGLIYGGTAWNSKLFVYDPLNKSITYLGQPIENGGIICGLAAIGSDIYGSTCDGGDSTYARSHLFVYNSTARIFTDLGQPVEGEMGSKISIGKDGKVYGGTSPNGYLFAYDTLSKAFTIIYQPVQGEGTAYPIIAGNNGKIYFSLNGSLYVFDPATSRIDNLLELVRFIPVSGEFFWSLTEGMDGNIYGGTAPNGYLFRYNKANGSVNFLRPIADETRIRALTTGINGKIYGGTGWGAFLFSYDSGYAVIPPTITFVPPTLANNSEVNVNYVNVSIMLNKPGGIVQLNWNGAVENMDGSGTSFFKNKTGLANDVYEYYVNASDAAGNFNTSETRRVTVNVTAPLPTGGIIHGTKFNDANGNRIRDPGEEGLANWTIRLRGIDTLTRTFVTRTAITDVNGNYSFTNLTPGLYTVSEILQPNWVPTILPSRSVRLTLNESAAVDFGNRRLTPAICNTSLIHGYNFNDSNKNGIFDAGELGLANRTIRLTGFDTCTNKPASRLMTTNATGYFKFENISAGTYVLSEAIQIGWLPTTSVAKRVTVPVNSTIIREDFGNRRI